MWFFKPLAIALLAVLPGTDPSEQMAAVNAHLQQMKKETVQDTSLIEQVIALVHTPEVKQRYAKKQAQALIDILPPSEIIDKSP